MMSLSLQNVSAMCKRSFLVLSDWISRLIKAEELKISSIAVPPLGGGVLELPRDKAAQIVVQNFIA